MDRTWSDVARECDVTPATVANWRAGRAVPSVDSALDLGDMLGVADTRELFVRRGARR